MPYTLNIHFNIILPTTSRSKEIKTTKKNQVIRYTELEQNQKPA